MIIFTWLKRHKVGYDLKCHNNVVAVISVVIGALGMVSKDLEKRLVELKFIKRVVTIQTKAQL